jgi:hypothetical protein
MGGTSTSTQQQSSSTTPYAGASGALNGILGGLTSMVPGAGSLTGAQAGALNSIEANASAGNPYAAPTASLATSLLGGGGAQNNDGAISANLSNYQGLLTPFANGSMVGKNPALQSQLDTLGSDVTNQVNSQFAAAGRDGSPANLQALGRGIAQAEAPVIAAQYNTDVGNQLNAANSLYGAGNTSYGLLNQNQAAANANAQAGVGVGSQALDAQNYGANSILAAEAQRQGIPVSQLTTLLGAISPVAQAFGTTNGTTNGANTESGAQQFNQLATGLGSLFKFTPSDRRLKEDIRRVGALDDGTPVYGFRYRGSPMMQIGLMADDVEKRVPEAVATWGGFKVVDYDLATRGVAADSVWTLESDPTLCLHPANRRPGTSEINP